MESNKFKGVMGILRISFGLIFLWAFFDKLLGWNYATKAADSWLAGGSPTAGFLLHGTAGPFASFYQGLGSSAIVEWLFMLGLIFIGISLTFGIMTKLGSLCGASMYLLMYTAVGMHSANHPFIDEHFTGFFVMLLFFFSDAGKYFGFGNQWANTSLVQKYPILK
jgi:thiosulfate dehydrogenase [quinone] large subunit